MSRILSDIWTKLEEARPTGEKLTARPTVPEVTDRIYCAIDASLKRHFLILLYSEDQHLSDSQSRGITVTTRELAIPGQDVSAYLDIECHDDSGHSAFDLIGGELASGLSKAGGQPSDVAKRVLSKWRRFWGQLPQQLLSREAQLGLFAELWFLGEWLLPKVGPGASYMWRGPLGARHDFELPEQSIEIKASTNTRGRIHHIHGIYQLEPGQNGPLFLFSLHLREEINAGNSLPSVIETCRQYIAPDGDALGRFESALLQVGYSPIHDEEYAKLRVRVEEEILFQVKDDFPRLTPAIFPLGLPAGVERVEYEVNLNTFNHLIVAKRAGDWLIE